MTPQQIPTHRQQLPNQLYRQLRTLVDSGLSLLFPPRCVGCEAWGWSLCPHCAQQVEPIGEAICWECGRPQGRAVAQCGVCRQDAEQASLTKPRMTRIAAHHKEPLSQAIYGLKYRGHRELAPILARYLFALLLNDSWAEPYRTVDGVIPVPLHVDRQRERGYNHAELLAKAFCAQMQLPLQSGWLIRRRATHTQVGLSAAERRTNVAQAFVAHPAVQGKRVIVLDDVYTTGATLNACAEALVMAGASAVYGLTLATPPQQNRLHTGS